MKRFFAMILAAVMLLSLAACGMGGDDIRGTLMDFGNKENDTPKETEKKPVAEATLPAATLPAVEEEPEETLPAETEPEFDLGVVEGLVYENEFIGIGCKLDSNWRFYSDEEIRQMNNMTADVMGDDFREAMANADIVYDMAAIHSNGLDNINVNMQKANPMQIAMLDLTAHYESQFAMLEEAFENMGYTNVRLEVGEITIDGETFEVLFNRADIAGYTICQVCISIKCNGYLANVTVSTFDEASLDELLDCFYLI